jgi:hypothetical protein
MKTGNKILLIFLGTIALGIFLCVLYIRFYSYLNKSIKDPQLVTQKIDINDFSFIRISDLESVKIKTADTSRIIQYYSLKGLKPELNYKVSNDTLILSCRSDKRYEDHKITICCKKSVKEVDGFNIHIHSFRLKTDTISIHLNQSQFDNWNSGKRDTVNISTISISAVNHSEVNFSKFRIDVLYLQMDSSTMNINSEVNKIQGTLKRGSELDCRNFNGEILLKKEKSCRINFYDYE